MIMDTTTVMSITGMDVATRMTIVTRTVITTMIMATAAVRPEAGGSEGFSVHRHPPR
jgi:hypothetical protein